MAEIEQINGAVRRDRLVRKEFLSFFSFPSLVQHLHHISNILYEIAKIIHDKRKTTTEEDPSVDEHHADL